MVRTQDKPALIWQVAHDALLGTSENHEYGGVMLPFVMLPGLDCVFEEQRAAVQSTHEVFKDSVSTGRLESVLLNSENGLDFHKISDYSLTRFVQDAWLEPSHHQIGYGINLTRHLYGYKTLHPVEEVTEDILVLDVETEGLLHGVLKG